MEHAKGNLFKRMFWLDSLSDEVTRMLFMRHEIVLVYCVKIRINFLLHLAF